MRIEEIKNEFYNDQFKQPKTFYRLDIGDKRHYYDVTEKDVIIYPSWTTVLGKTLPTSEHLIEWIADNGMEKANEIKYERSEYGTFLHILIADFLKKKSIDVTYEAILDKMLDHFGNDINGNVKWIEDLQNDLLAFAQFCIDHSFELVASEITLASRKYGVAGTIDIVGYIKYYNKKILILMDIKSGRKGFYEQHILQLAGYKETWNENFPNYPIDKVYNWAPKDWRTKPSYSFTDQTEKAIADILPNLVSTYKIMHPVKRTIRQYSGKLKLGIDLENNYKSIDIVDFIREKFNLDKPTNEKYQPKLVTTNFEDF
jgi:hypothetical protein